jgi:hypothetical protein
VQFGEVSVQADYAVELGAEDEVLELPWAAPNQGLQYYDLKRHPELLGHVSEAKEFPELGAFLAAINSSRSMLQTAKCDAWFSRDMNPEEDIFGAAIKFGSYVDLLFSAQPRHFSLVEHENLAKNLAGLLKRVPEIPASTEFLIRRCYYRTEEGATEDGFYITYVFGYGADEQSAFGQWAIGLKLVENAILQFSFSG